MAKLDNKKFMVCSADLQSVLLMKITLQKVLKKYQIKPALVHHSLLEEAKAAAANFQVVFCSRNFLAMFKDAQKKGTAVLGLKNVLSDREMELALREADLLD